MRNIPNKKEFAATVHEQKLHRSIAAGLLSVEAVRLERSSSRMERNTIGACSYCAVCGSDVGKSRSK